MPSGAGFLSVEERTGLRISRCSHCGKRIQPWRWFQIARVNTQGTTRALCPRCLEWMEVN